MKRLHELLGEKSAHCGDIARSLKSHASESHCYCSSISSIVNRTLCSISERSSTLRKDNLTKAQHRVFFTKQFVQYIGRKDHREGVTYTFAMQKKIYSSSSPSSSSNSTLKNLNSYTPLLVEITLNQSRNYH
jgi:hypothetical protein